jgi:hypothetical protein
MKPRIALLGFSMLLIATSFLAVRWAQNSSGRHQHPVPDPPALNQDFFLVSPRCLHDHKLVDLGDGGVLLSLRDCPIPLHLSQINSWIMNRAKVRREESLESISTISRESSVESFEEGGNLSAQAPRVRRKCAPFTEVFPVGGCPAKPLWKFERTCPQQLEEQQEEFDMMMKHIDENFKSRGKLRCSQTDS